MKTQLNLFLACILFGASLHTAKGQSGHSRAEHDSLWAIWTDTAEADTNRIKALHSIARTDATSAKPDSAYYYAQLLYDFAESKGLVKSMAAAVATQGIYYEGRRDYENALKYHQKSLKLYEEIDMKAGISSALLFIGGLYYEQGLNSESLENYFRGLKICEEIGDETNTTAALANIGLTYMALRDFPNALEYHQRSFKRLEAQGNKWSIANSLVNLGITYINLGDYTNALDCYLRSLKLMEEVGSKAELAKALSNIGVIHIDQGDFPTALDYYQRSLKVREEMGDSSAVAISLLNIGVVYINQGDRLTALDYYQRSAAISNEVGNKLVSAYALLNIGVIYSNQSDSAKALDYFLRSLILLEEIDDKRVISSVLSNIGGIFTDQGDYERALAYHERSLKKSEEIGYKTGIGEALFQIAYVHMKQEDYDKSLNIHQEVSKIREEIGDKTSMAQSYIAIGNLYFRKKKYKEAVVWCGKGQQMAEDIGSVYNNKDACDCLYLAYKALDKGKEALLYLEKFGVLSEQLNREETDKQLGFMEFKKVMLQDSIAKVSEARRIEQTHREEVRQKDRANNIALGSGLMFLLLAGGLFTRVRYIRKSKAVLQVEKDRSENLLLNILPAEIAEELKQKGRADARDFDMVSILFTDFKGFTEASAKLTAQDLVAEINSCFEAFDGIMAKYGIEKIKTIGDAYMAAGGLPVPMDNSVKNTVLAALEMQEFIAKRKIENQANEKHAFEMRVGIHTGPVVAGIVGVKKFQYDIWGDTVNTASRMESSGEVGKVNVSQSTFELLKESASLSTGPEFSFESRGKIEAKGKGEIEMYFVSKKINQQA